MKKALRFHYHNPEEFSEDISTKVEMGELDKKQALARLQDIMDSLIETLRGGSFFELEDSGSFRQIDPLDYFYELIDMMKQYDPINRGNYDSILSQLEIVRYGIFDEEID